MTQRILSNIQDVKVIPLKQILDERGKIMHMLKCTDTHFKEFADINFAISFPGVIRAWHKRKTMTSNIAVIFGKVKWVLFDDRKDSPTNGCLDEYFLGEGNYFLLQIPPNIVSGYKTIGTSQSIVANCTDETHSDDGKINIDPFSNDIPYNWDLIHR